MFLNCRLACVVGDVSDNVCKGSCALNPIVYIAMNSSFRKQVQNRLLIVEGGIADNKKHKKVLLRKR